MKTLNIGLVGYGFMGRTHSNAFLQAPRFFELPYRPVLKAVAAQSNGARRGGTQSSSTQPADSQQPAPATRPRRVPPPDAEPPSNPAETSSISGAKVSTTGTTMRSKAARYAAKPLPAESGTLML